MDDAPNAKETLNDIKQMKLTAFFRDATGRQAQGELLLLSQYSPMNHHIKVQTSTRDAKVFLLIYIYFVFRCFRYYKICLCFKVGEYLMLHVHSNFYMPFFNYLVMSKGIILITGQENMQVT